MAKKGLKKIELKLEKALKQVAVLEEEKRIAEETIQREIGKNYFKIQKKKNKEQTYDSVLEDLKLELAVLKEEENKQRLEKRNESETENFSGEFPQ
ncbi:hypothetical protein [Streptococcus danieliae]|uniref:Uncharacterized protein n=1 Tax=Streptococcus danieliae TaxID=747656 RepID=A0A7Z0M564_9STRE|nr:hypothetical protein [Streptococcus danieliae]MBF0698816.1 hypothetical protein [Streptococcus danieliae]NYS95993.1 hypothetical protein [Streptococcus danieliae]